MEHNPERTMQAMRHRVDVARRCWDIYDEEGQKFFTGTYRLCEDWLDCNENVGAYRQHQFECRPKKIT